MRFSSIAVTLLVLSVISILHALNFDDFGAIANVERWDIALRNADALLKAINAANSSTTNDRTIIISSGKTYYMYATNITDIHDITIQLDGKLKYSDDIQNYPNPGTRNIGLLYFLESSNIHLTGKGEIDGQGLKWWRYTYTGTDNRPDLIMFKYSYNIHIDSLYLYSSPKFSINFVDCRDIIIHDITIYINSTLARGRDKHSSATYALNTDGIDIAAYNVTIYNTQITNYDDAIVAKPCRSTWRYCTCAGNILAYNNTINYSTGLTIGSVPPNPDINCIRNVTFRDTIMHRPLKALYIKPNPGTQGTGIIDNIVYENIEIDHALWWTIYVGPQQQNQPGGDSGTGCNFLFPFVPICPTQPLVSITNIVFRHVHAVETLPLFEGPGVFLCDPANPCKDIVFDDVTNTVFTGTLEDIYAALPIFYIPGIVFPTPMRSDDWEFEYIVSNAYGQITNSDPVPCFNDPSCFWSSS